MEVCNANSLKRDLESQLQVADASRLGEHAVSTEPGLDSVPHQVVQAILTKIPSKAWDLNFWDRNF